MHQFDVKTIKNVELRRKTFKTTQNYKSDQIIMHCIDLTSKRSKELSYVPKLQKWSNYNELHRFDIKRSKMFSYFAKHSKQRKTTKVIKLQLIASIWCQKHQTNTKLHKIYFDEFASIWRENDQNNTKLRSDQIIMHSIDLTSKLSKELSYVPKLQKWSNYTELNRFDIKRSKMFSYFAKHSKQRKTTKVIKL